jgi:hypothetical protein
MKHILPKYTAVDASQDATSIAAKDSSSKGQVQSMDTTASSSSSTPWQLPYLATTALAR